VFRTLFLLTLVLSGVRAAEKEDADDPYKNVQVLARAMQLIRQDYVTDGNISYRDLTYSALEGMMERLDPHSQFMNPDAFDGMQEETRSEFGGLGVVVTFDDGALTILNPIEDTPGFEAGLLPGDRILRINGESTDKLTLANAVEKLRGDVGEKATLTVQRPSTKEIKDYTLTRVTIKMKSVKDIRLLPVEFPGGKKIGYARLTKFTEPTAEELAAAVDGLEKQGMEAFVLDLRNNPGGLLDSAVDVCGLFVPPATKVVYTVGRTPGKEYRTSGAKGKSRKYPVAILTNYASASGSEVVAGALKDLKRAIVVGETTFGKGSVQSVISLPDGSALRLTTAKYFTPGGQVIHGQGVKPTVKAILTPEEELLLWKARRDPVTGLARPVDPDDDPQLARAVDLLRGTLIFSGRQKPEKKL